MAIEQMDKALDQLTGQANGSRGKAVHNTRKGFKKIRALLRLVRDEMGRAYPQENACFRDAGRLLSDVRDAQVRLETFDKLIKHFAVPSSSDTFAQVRKVITAQHRAASRRMLNQENTTAKVIPMIQTARERVKAWPLTHNDWSALHSGLKRAYKQGRKGFTHAFDEPTVESLHEWRKAVKDLWYHLRMLQPVWPDLLGEMVDQSENLANYLGDDHDLAVLHQWLQEQSEVEATVEALAALIQRRRTQLQQSARSLGERVYAERPRAFVERIETYWQAWQAGIKQPISVEL